MRSVDQRLLESLQSRMADDLKTADEFGGWAIEEIARLKLENEGLRIDLRRASMPCGCESDPR